MQVGDATRQATAPGTERDDRMSSMAMQGAEASTAADGQTKAEGLRQMDAVVERNKLWRAYERVVRNKGAAGVDGLTVADFKAWLQQHWPAVRAALLASEYMPRAVRKVEIPKPNGGVRTLGIPTVLDRLIQQALLQVLQPEFEPEFSEHSYGFRPGRNAWQAVQQAQSYIREGRRWVVDLDLEKFFHRFCRYADDCNIYVRSEMAGTRDGCHHRLSGDQAQAPGEPGQERRRTTLDEKVPRIQLHSAQAGASEDRGRQYEATEGQGAGNRCRECIAQSLDNDQRAQSCAAWLDVVLPTDGGKRCVAGLDGWIRRKLRCLLWRQWKRPATRNRMLQAKGLDATRAWKSASNGRGPWWNAGASHMNTAYPKSFFDALGLVSLQETRQRFQFVE